MIWPLLALSAACGGGLEKGAPLADLDDIAARASGASGTGVPMRVLFEWEYVDERGNLRGDGVARVNPPDRFRLDLFTTGDGAMRAVLVDDLLTTDGVLEEDVELPSEPFLYAMTGVFRPGPGEPVEGFESGDYRVLGFETAGGARRYFYLSADRLVRVEDRRGSRVERRIELEWGADPTWPREARYRDDVTPSAVRWELGDVRPETEPFPEEIYARPRSR